MPVKGRISKYYYFTVGLGLSAFMFYSIKFTHFSGNCVKTPTNDVLESLPKNDLLAEFLIVYLFMGIFSTVFAFKKLFRSGFNNEGRSFFFKKQFGYVLAFSISWQV